MIAMLRTASVRCSRWVRAVVRAGFAQSFALAFAPTRRDHRCRRGLRATRVRRHLLSTGKLGHQLLAGRHPGLTVRGRCAGRWFP